MELDSKKMEELSSSAAQLKTELSENIAENDNVVIETRRLLARNDHTQFEKQLYPLKLVQVFLTTFFGIKTPFTNSKKLNIELERVNNRFCELEEARNKIEDNLNKIEELIESERVERNQRSIVSDKVQKLIELNNSSRLTEMSLAEVEREVERIVGLQLISTMNEIPIGLGASSSTSTTDNTDELRSEEQSQTELVNTSRNSSFAKTGSITQTTALPPSDAPVGSSQLGDTTLPMPPVTQQVDSDILHEKPSTPMAATQAPTVEKALPHTKALPKIAEKSSSYQSDVLACLRAAAIGLAIADKYEHQAYLAAIPALIALELGMKFGIERVCAKNSKLTNNLKTGVLLLTAVAGNAITYAFEQEFHPAVIMLDAAIALIATRDLYQTAKMTQKPAQQGI